MIKEAIGTGRTVEEAIEEARSSLGPQEADIEFEVLELPKKSFFGLKSNPARVRAYVNLPDPEPVKAPAPETREQPKPYQQPKKESKPKPQSPKPEKPTPTEQAKPAAPVEPAKPSEPVDPAKIEKAHVYLGEVFAAMNLTDLTITPGESEGAIVLKVEGAESAAVIGRRGETLDALQYLTSLAANRGEGNYARVIIDTGNYRERRQETLEALAKRLAERVVRTGRSHTLEPMNAYERRIIHSAVSQVKGANSASTGEEPNRRVVISSKRHGGGTGGSSSSGGQRSDRNDRGGDRGGNRGRGGDRGGDRRGGGRDRNGRPRREKPEPYKESSTREVPPKEAEDKPLYGKIEL